MRLKFIVCLVITGFLAKYSGAQAIGNVKYVDPTIGGVGLILEPTRPTVHLPNSMVRVFPNRKDQLDDQISYFPLTISSHRQPSLFAFMPYSGKRNENSWKETFTWDDEITTPYYYSVRLVNNGDSIAFTPAARSGFFRLSFKGNTPHYLRLGVLNETGEINLQGKRIITGKEEVSGLPAFFYAEINSDVSGIEYVDAGHKKAFLKIGGNAPLKIAFKYGISFISIEQAKENLYKEIPAWDFVALKNKARQAWDNVLGQITVKGGTEAQKKVFYTSLYRCYERMVNINEYGKYYSAYDHQVHQSIKPFYVDNWLWDTYIALEPLQAILNPQMQNDKINSYINMYEQSGWMPSFALAFGDNPCMTGNHAATWFADSWMKGIRGFDIQKAYDGLRKNSLEATLLPWKNGPATSLDSFYTEHGYFPALKPGAKETVSEVHSFEKRQAISVTLENSYSDWCIAQLAGVVNKKDDQALFLKRAGFYKNVYRKDKGFMWPKDSDGNWIEPFDPKFSGGQGGREYTTENNVYTYNWSANQDLSGLFELMGGRVKAEAKLDQLFREDLGRSKYSLWSTFPDATGLVGQYVMGNEPSFHIPYLYNYLGAPWKTQKRIRMLMATWYTDNLFGIPGDEDGGGMTAFVVFSMMGFFPSTPGVPVYAIGSPVFSQLTINLPGGKKFIINAPNNSTRNKYVQNARLNGLKWNKSWFTHADLLKGGTLLLNMGNVPNKQWGSEEKNLPPSAMNLNPLTLTNADNEK